MLKRIGHAWLPVLVALLLVGQWLATRGPAVQSIAPERPVEGEPGGLEGESPSPSTMASAAPSTETSPDRGQIASAIPTSTTMAGAKGGTPGPATSTTAGSTDPTGQGTTSYGSTTGSTYGQGTSYGGTTAPRYGTDEERGRYDDGTAWDEGADRTSSVRDGTTYGQDYGATSRYGDTTPDYGTRSTYGDTTRDTGTGSTYGERSTTYGEEGTYGDTTSGYGTRSTYGDTTSTYGTRSTYGDTATTTAARERAYTFHLFDGFERANQWAVESAADHADLSLGEENASAGKALKAAFKAFGKGNFELRREVSLDLTDATAAKVDVYNGAGPMDLVLGLRAGYDTTLFTTPPQPILQGRNEDVTFRLADLSTSETGPYGTSWAWSRDRVSRVSLIFRERDQTEGTVYIDNLRFDRPAADLGLKTKPELQTITTSAEVVERYETLELGVDFQADYQDFFDRTEIDVVASFFSPSGKRLDVRGFVYDTDEAAAKPIWKVRFTPTEVGQWRYDVTVKAGFAETQSATRGFLCHRKSDHRGYIGISKHDPRYFEFDDGSFYYPIGQNVCWASNYEHFLDKIQGYGGNYVRVWLCPWNLQLEDPRESGTYDLRVAKALDELLEQCRRRGIYLQLVLRYHGMHDADWSKNPYNSANGGPCISPGQFFTSLTAKDLYKRFLDYVVARWGHSTALFAWELWNEADLARADRDSDLVAWHKEMAAYLKKMDNGRHLVTTSVATPTRCTALFELPQIDFVPVHFYAKDVFDRIHDNWVRFRELRKPVFIGEFSGGHKPADDLADEQGVRIHAGLWLAFTTPLAGNAMPWWWDTYIDKNGLYGHWAALAKFAAGVDRRGRDFELIRSKVQLGDDAWASLQGLVAPDEAYLWVYDEARILRPEQAGRPLLLEDRPVRLGGMLGGTFRVEVWDTYTGTILDGPEESREVESADGALTFTLPKCSRDIAVKIVKDGRARPRIEW